MANHPHVEIYEDRGGEYRWRFVAGNGERTEGPLEGYTRPWSAKRAARGNHSGVECRNLYSGARRETEIL